MTFGKLDSTSDLFICTIVPCLEGLRALQKEEIKMTEREKELAMRMANANAPKDPIQELREAIQYEKDELRKQVQKSWFILGLFAFMTVVISASFLIWAWGTPENVSSFHATHFERAVLADYNGKKTVYLINGNDTTRLEVR